ncbi:MAG: hypothetical protein GY937_01290 [bacterium]|nr:hypothetical protein [bacterium]
MTEPVTVKPESLTMGADQTQQFSASGLDWDVCHVTDLTNDDRLSWSTDGGGSVAAGLYTPPLFKPSKIEIEWPYRPDQVDFCTSANFEAKVTFEDPGPQRVVAAYDSEVGEAVVELTPPPEPYIRARLNWDPGRHIGTFGWGDQHDPKPMVVTATYTDGPHTLSEQIEIDVVAPSPFLVFRRLPEKVRVGATHGLLAKLGFERIRNCAFGLEDVTDESKFTVTAPDDSISTDKWIKFDQNGKYHVHAEYAFPNTGKVLTVDQDVEATSLRATVRVGPVTPGPATGQKP